MPSDDGIGRRAQRGDRAVPRALPGRNDDEFRATITSEADRDAVRAVLDETLRIRVDRGQESLGEIGDEVRDVVRGRYPELSDAAVEKLGNYFTYLVK